MPSENEQQPTVGELADEFLERYRRGERPALSEYVERYPHFADEIRDVFPGLAMLEDLGPELPVEGVEPVDTGADLSREQLGDFRMIREVGRGGMGVVYEAEQVSLGRRVALKVLPRQLWQDGKHARRFEREARAAARLHHTNIVPVFGVGEQDGLHYYVMQFIQGLSLDQVLDELKELREASEAARVEGQGVGVEGPVSRDQAADVDVAAAAEMHHEDTRDASAFGVAQSLLSGRFERTVMLEGSQSSQESAVSDPVSPLNSEPSTLNSPDTAVGRLSDTHLSGSFVLPGQSEASSRAQSRSIYWQSVARIGVQAADALEYAHDQGIIHRDVKPSNLLLDTRGTIWITDFGLAKAADQQDLTHTGDVLGTLRYMAPEQFDGKADGRSDVYSLGLTLYELLSLQPAFNETDRYRLVKQVTHSTPPRLGTLDPSIPRDLETIVHKAIDRDASHRYQSARELAEDLQRYLGDEPIRARRISPVARVRRWCKRNPAGATVAALLLIGFIGSGLAAAVFLNQAQEYAELAETEKELREIAERERQRADENFDQAWSAVDRFYATVSQSRLLNVPGTQSLRRELLTDALDYYRQFIEQESGNPDLQKELADAQLGLARISRELGLPEQRNAFRDALTLYRQLARELPEDAEVRHGLATCYLLLGSYLQAIDIWDRLLEEGPENAVYRKDLADALNSLANRQDEEQNYEAALETHQRALYLRMDLLRAAPGDPQLHASLGSTLNNIGVLLSRQDRTEEALAMYRQAIEHDEFALEQEPGNILFGRFVGIGARNIAYQERYLGRPEEAERWFRRAAEVRARIASANPDVAYLQSDAYDAWRLLAEHLNETDQPEAAADAFRRAGDVLERLPQRTADELYRLGQVYALASTGLAPAEGVEDEPTPEQLAERRQLADLAVDSLQRAVDAGFREAERLETDEDLAALQMRSDFTELLARVETLAEFEQTRPVDPETGDERDQREDEAAAQYSIGLLKTLFDEPDEALTALIRSAELREELLEIRPSDRTLRTDLAQTHRALADLAWRNDRYADAREHWEDLFAVLEAAESGELNKELAVACYDFGEALARSGMLDEALPYLSRRLELNPAGGMKPLRALYLAQRELGNDAAALDVAWLAVDRLTTDRQSQGTAATAVMLPLLLPEHLDEEQLNRLVKLVEQIRGRASGEAVWVRRTLGLAAYRAGRFEDALEVLVTGDYDAGVQCGFVRAMALHRLERFEESERELEATLANHYRSEINAYRPDGSGVMRTFWNMWYVADWLRKEAETLILGAPRPRQPMVMLHRARNYALLGNLSRANELFDAAVEAEPESGFIRVMRVRFLAAAGHLDRAQAEFPRARELFLAEQQEGDRTPHAWHQVGIAAQICGEQQVAADLFATAVAQQTRLLQESPVDAQMRTQLDGIFDNLATELSRLGADDELHDAHSERRELYETLAINPLMSIDGHAAPYVWSVAVLPDGQRALSAAQDGNVCLWDLETGDEIRRYEHHGPVLRVVPLPGGEQFLTAGYEMTIRLWDVESGNVVREFRGHTDHVSALALSTDGSRAISAGEDETLRVWDVGSGELLRSVSTDGSVRSVAMSPDSRRVLCGPFLADNYAVSLWDVETGEKLHDFAAHESTVYCVAYSSDGRRAVSGDQSGLVVLWDLESGDELQRWKENWGEARTATILDDDRILLGTGSGALAILDADSGRVIQRLDGNIRHYDLAVLPTGRHIVTSDADATLRLWSLPLLAPPDEAAELITRQFDALAPAPEAQIQLADQIASSGPILDRLIELRPDAPPLQIARGKSIAEQGDWDAAAAALQPVLAEQAQPTIVETRWWATDSYAGHVHGSFFPAEENLDPFQPVGGSANVPWQLAWNSAQTGSDGRLTLFTQDSNNRVTAHSSAYALRRIYATQPSTPLYLFRADNTANYWLNGKLLDVPHAAMAVQLPIELELQPGWNTLLVKVINYAGTSDTGSWLEMRRVDDVESPETQRQLIQAALLRGEWDLALERWKDFAATEWEADDLASWNNLTDILIDTGSHQEQKVLLEALFAWHAGDHDSASQRYRDAVAVNPHVFLKHPRLADLRGTLEELLGVEQRLTEAIQQQPDSAEYWRDRAWFYWRRDEHEQATADFQHAIDRNPPKSVEPGWTLGHTTILPGASSAHFSPRDGAVYIGTRYGGTADGVYRVDPDGGSTRLAETPAVMGLVVDSDSGDVFVSDSQTNLIHRLEGGAGPAEVWVSTFNTTDSDPMGMAFVPAEFAGNRMAAGDLLVVDGGFGGDDEIYAISTRQSHRVTRLHRDGEGFGPLTQATDVTVGKDGIYLTDAGDNAPGRIYRLEQDGRLTPVPTNEEIPQPVAVAADPLTGDLLVLDVNRKAVLRVNPTTGAVSTCIAALNVTWDSVAGLDVSPDGTQLLIADHGASAVFAFRRTALGLARQSVRTLLMEGRWDEAAEQLNAALDEETPPFVFASDWWVTGPYPQTDLDDPHFSPADNLDPSRPSTGTEVEAIQPDWRRADLDANGRLDFVKLFSGSAVDYTDGYALIRIYASVEQTVLYRFAAMNHMQLWVNGQFAGLGRVPATEDAAVQIALRQGWNTLLFKVRNAYARFELEARLVRREEVSSDEWNHLVDRAADIRDPQAVIDDLTAQIAAAEDAPSGAGESGSPDLPALYLKRAAALARLERFDDAAADAVVVLESLPPDDPSEWRMRPMYQSLFDRTENREELFARLVAARPDDMRLWVERACYFARHGDWPSAARHYAHVIESFQPDVRVGGAIHHHTYARLLVLSGDHEAFKTLCRTLVNEVDDSRVLHAYSVGRICSITPDSGIPAQRVLDLLEPYAADASKGPDGLDLLVLSIGQLWAGRYDEAIATAKSSGVPERPIAFVVALAHHFMGQDEDAATWYKKAMRSFDTRPLGETGSVGFRLLLNTLRREALREFEPEKYHEELATEYARQERWEEAAVEVDSLLDLISAEALPEWQSSPVYQALCERIDDRDDVFGVLAALRPDDDLLWIERARYLAGRDEWERAAQHYEHAEAIEQGGNRQREYLCTLVMSGRRDEYDAFCRELIENRSNESLDYPTCWGCALFPNPQLDQGRLIAAIQADTRYKGEAHQSAALAVANIAAGQLEPAILHAEEAAKVTPYRPAAAFILAIAHHRLGRFDESREWYAQGIDALKTPPNPEGAILMRFWGKLLQREALREIKPPDPTTPDAEPWYAHVILLLDSGDTQVYREFCAQLLTLHGDTADPTTAGLVAWIATIAPDAVADPQQLVRLAELQVQADRAAIHLYKLGTALYRAGRYVEALETLSETVEVRGNGGAIWDWLFLALTHWRLGHADEARDAVATAVDRLDDPATQLKWHEAIDLRMLRREAEELLRSDAPGSESDDNRDNM